jgi:hypothetical protein
MSEKLKKKSKDKWNEGFILKAYKCAKSGLKGVPLAQALGISWMTFRKWKNRHPYFKEAIEQARKEAGAENTTGKFLEYIYEQLPDELKPVWERIQACEKAGSGHERVEAALQRGGLYMRMHLFFHAYVHYNFNISQACKSVNISLDTFRGWTQRFPQFAQLMDQFHEHKKNFYESKLVELVRDGDPSATIFVNKTINRDRGYNEKVELTVSGSVEHNHNFIDLDGLDLSLEVRKQILEAVRKKEQRKQLQQQRVLDALDGNIIEGEVLKIESNQELMDVD